VWYILKSVPALKVPRYKNIWRSVGIAPGILDVSTTQKKTHTHRQTERNSYLITGCDSENEFISCST
jgi:hypothetical protein